MKSGTAKMEKYLATARHVDWLGERRRSRDKTWKLRSERCLLGERQSSVIWLSGKTRAFYTVSRRACTSALTGKSLNHCTTIRRERNNSKFPILEVSIRQSHKNFNFDLCNSLFVNVLLLLIPIRCIPLRKHIKFKADEKTSFPFSTFSKGKIFLFLAALPSGSFCHWNTD